VGNVRERENSTPEKCSKSRTVPICPVHAVLGGCCLALALRLLFQLLVESILDYPIMRSYPLRTWYQMAAKEKMRSICSKISAHHLKRFENSTNMSSKGRFWYDATCGAWGVEGGPTAGSIYPFNHENDKDKPNEMDFPLIKTISHGFIWT